MAKVMFTKWTAVVLTLSTIASGCVATPPVETPGAATSDMDVKAHLDQIMQWWPGDYNNDRQIARLKSEGKPVWMADDQGKGGHIEVTSHYRKIDLPAFGEHVLYVEETKHNNPEDMFRQRIYSLHIDEASNQLRVVLWNFKDRKKYVGAWRDLSRLKALTPDDMTSFGANCDLFMSQENGKYRLAMHEKDCAFDGNYFSYQVLLGPDSFWFRDKIARVSDDAPVSVAGDFTYHELDRISSDNVK